MCHKKPGPRCSAHAFSKLQKARRTFAEDPSFSNFQAMKEEEKEYDITPAGQAELGRMMDKELDPLLRTELQYRLKHAIAERKARLAKVKASATSGDAAHEATDEEKGLLRPEHQSSEDGIVSTFFPGSRFQYGGKMYETVMAGKPRPTRGGGEPKTDIYVLAKDQDGKPLEFKISYKQSNADFIENKISPARFRSIFGDDQDDKIIAAASSVLSERSPIVQGSRRHPITFADGSRGHDDIYTLGYRLDVMKNPCGGYVKFSPTHEQLMEIYAGSNLPDEKKHAVILGYNNNAPIPNSGVANYMLVGDNYQSAQGIVDQLEPISTYVEKNPDVYLAFKAVNYRKHADKYDDNRPLAVYVDYSQNKDGNIEGTLNLSQLFAKRTTDVMAGLREHLPS